KEGGHDREMECPGHLPTGCALLGGRGAGPQPVLLPGGQPGKAAQRPLEHASTGQGRHQGSGMVFHTTPPRGERIAMLWRNPGTDHPFSASAAELVMVRPPTVSSPRAGCLTAC